MYPEFYGFSEDPFALTPDVKFLFLTDNHQRILDSLVHGITQKKGFSLVMGVLGSGKTTLMLHLISILDPQVKTVFIDRPPRTFEELLEAILLGLGLQPEGPDKSSMLWQFNAHLQKDLAPGESVLICVDEAQNLGEEVMEELRLLANPDPRTPGPPIVQELFVGDLSIEEKLKARNLRQLLQRITTTCRLEPLSPKESAQYIAHRLNGAGGVDSEIFTPDAVDSICRMSGGIPRAVNMLCSLALSAGCAVSRKRVDAELVEGVSWILQVDKSRERRRREAPWGGLLRSLGDSSPIMKVTYALWAYSLLVLGGVFFLKVFF